MRLTWRKQPSETVLARVVQRPRGAILKIDGEDVGRVSALSDTFGPVTGWYWVTPPRDKMPYCNTWKTPAATLDEAKSQCEAYVRRYLGLPAKKAKR